MQTEISRTKRHLPPAHYSLKFKAYSLLSEIEYRSGVFEAGGYKWRLVFYPNGDKKKNGENYISLYLAIVETDALPLAWEVNASFKLFVHDQLEDKYLTIQFQGAVDHGVKRFQEMKIEWGFAQLLALETFKDPSNGYLVDDICVFGTEVFVINHTGNWESISLVKSPMITNPIFTWEIGKFSDYDKEYYFSEKFTVGGKTWNLKIYPNGANSDKGKALSLFLMPSSNWKSDPNKTGVYAECKLRLLNQVNGKHSHENTVSYFFGPPKYTGCGFREFITLEDLRKPSNQFLVMDMLRIQVEFVVVSETECFNEISKSKRQISTE